MRPPTTGRPWPTPAQLQQMGLVRCKTDGCTTFVDPANVPQRQCTRHQQADRRRDQRRRWRQRDERFQHRPRVRTAA